MLQTQLQKKYYTIGEVTEIIALPAHVIRFWEKNFLSIKPQKARGRRYYKKADIDQILLIKKLLYTDNHSIKTAQSILYKSSNLRGFKPNHYAKKAYNTAITANEFNITLESLLLRLYASRNKLEGLL